jgi:hypothetical protein
MFIGPFRSQNQYFPADNAYSNSMRQENPDIAKYVYLIHCSSAITEMKEYVTQYGLPLYTIWTGPYTFYIVPSFLANAMYNRRVDAYLNCAQAFIAYICDNVFDNPVAIDF